MSGVTPEGAGRHSQWFNKAPRQLSFTKAPRPLCRDLSEIFTPTLPMLTWVPMLLLGDVFPCGPFGHITVAGSKSHPMCRLCFTQHGLLRRIAKKQFLYLRRHLALFWLLCCSLLVQIVPRAVPPSVLLHWLQTFSASH